MKKIKEWESRAEKRSSKYCRLDSIFGGSQPSGNTTALQKSEPWEGVQPYLRDIFQRAANQSQQPALAGQSWNTVASQNMTANRALSGNPLNPAAQNGLLSTINGSYLSPDSNPYLKSSVNDALGLAKSQINGQFTGDNYGNSAHQEWLARGLGTAATNAYANNYQNERNRQMAAIGQAPLQAASDYTDLGQLGQVGAAQDTRNQAVTDSPWAQLQKYQQLVSGQGGGSSQSSNPYFTNPAANALGLGAGALGIYGMAQGAGLLGGATSLAAPMAATAGAGDLATILAMIG